MKKIAATFIMLVIALATYAQSELSVNPQVPDYIYARRMEHLDKQSPIKLDYNSQVRAYIDVYLERRRDHLANIIGRAELYFPIFEEYLSKYNLPQELKYLAIIESALDPKAKSKSGAMGLWQFLYHAGVMLDLNVTSYEDDRCDVLKSTDAACRYLAYLFQNLGDWQLALAAYNGGIGQVQKAQERGGGDKKTFWELAPYLTPEMQSYVPAFIAVNYVMNYYELHNIIPNSAAYKFDDIDTVYVSINLSFDQISRASGAERNDLRQLNPQYIKDFIPFEDTPKRLVLPKGSIERFLKNERRLRPDVCPDMTGYFGLTKFERVKTLHVVQPGEYLHKIAMKFQTSAEQIMEWNGLTSKNINAGQELTIWYDKEVSPFFFVVEEMLSQKE